MPSSFGSNKSGNAKGFWGWYGRHYSIILWVTTLLFILQVAHLYWLGAHVILLQLLGWNIWDPSPFVQNIIIAVDFTEIPALISTSFLYFYDLRKRWSWKPVLFLILLNSQWLHLFWITDEFVVEQFAHTHSNLLPRWLAWVAIGIDYLEVPVMIDTFMKSWTVLRKSGVRKAIQRLAD
jgi:hypothetical protein